MSHAFPDKQWQFNTSTERSKLSSKCSTSPLSANSKCLSVNIRNKCVLRITVWLHLSFTVHHTFSSRNSVPWLSQVYFIYLEFIISTNGDQQTPLSHHIPYYNQFVNPNKYIQLPGDPRPIRTIVSSLGQFWTNQRFLNLCHPEGNFFASKLSRKHTQSWQ